MIISSKLLLKIYEYLRQRQIRKNALHEKQMSERVLTRSRMLSEMILPQGSFIESQADYPDISYGASTIKKAGCEIIAVYNALVALQSKGIVPSFADLISRFEEDGMAFEGRIGTSPVALRDYFDRQKMETVFAVGGKDVDKISESTETLILTIYNDRRNIFKQIHTICITKEADGFVAHNACGNGKPSRRYDTVRELLDGIRAGKAGVISVLGIM